MSETPTVRIESPVTSWFGRFREDFRFSARSYSTGVGKSFGAIAYKFVTKLPVRVYWLGRHLVVEGVNVFRREEPPPVEPSGRRQARKSDSFAKKAGIWSGILAIRTLDLVSIGEVLNFVEHVVKPNTRPLTAVEEQEARKVFGDSLDYWRIRLDEWSLIAHFGAYSYRKRTKKTAKHMAMTVFNTIHFSRRIECEPGNADMAWLIHELTHTAQSEHTGGGFMIESLVAQGKEGYDYGGPAALAGKNLRDFNREQQGDIVKDYYWIISNKKTVTEPERADYDRMIAQLRAGKL